MSGKQTTNWRVETNYPRTPAYRVVVPVHPASGILATIVETDSEDHARLIAAAPEMLEAAKDALSGWQYIRQFHGDLYGVSWDRVEDALKAALAKAEDRS